MQPATTQIVHAIIACHLLAAAWFGAELRHVVVEQSLRRSLSVR